MIIKGAQLASFIYSLPPDNKVRTIDQLVLDAITHAKGGFTLKEGELVGRRRKARLNDLMVFEDSHQKKAGLKSIERESPQKQLVRWRQEMFSKEQGRIQLRNRALL